MTLHLLKQLKSLAAFWLYLALMIIGGIVLLIQDKGDFVLFINSHHSRFGDVFFKYWTYLGDGWVFAIVFVIALFFSFYNSLLLTISVIIQTIIVQFLKRFLFNEMVRPKIYFEDDSILNYVEGVDVHSYHAFPSGHTATAFTVAMFFIVVTKNKTISLIAILAACLVGISRVYILQHFLVDIYFGSVVGIISVFSFYIPSQKIGLGDKSPWNKALMSPKI